MWWPIPMDKGPHLLPLSVAILMGGMSRRFGSHKAFFPYRGMSLAAYLLEESSTFSNEVFAVSREKGQVPPDVPGYIHKVTDFWEEEGPLSGLHAALTHSTQASLFLRAVDMPFIKREVVEGLFRIWQEEDHPDVVVPWIEGRWEPLCALWNKDVLASLEPGKWRSFQQMLSGEPFRIREVPEEEMRSWDPELGSLKNFNTQQDWVSLTGKS